MDLLIGAYYLLYKAVLDPNIAYSDCLWRIHFMDDVRDIAILKTRTRLWKLYQLGSLPAISNLTQALLCQLQLHPNTKTLFWLQIVKDMVFWNSM